MQSVVARIPKDILESIDEILSYDWEGEQNHFEQINGISEQKDGSWIHDGTKKPVDIFDEEYTGHVFPHMVKVNEFINSLEKEENKAGRLAFSKVLDEEVKCPKCGTKDSIVYNIIYPFDEKPGIPNKELNLCLECFSQAMLNW